MKLSAYPNVVRFLTMMFGHFTKHNITCMLTGTESTEELLGRILDSEFMETSEEQGMHYIDFMLPQEINEGEVYMFNFRPTPDNRAYILIDLGEHGMRSFMVFYWDREPAPPYLVDFNQSCISFEEFSQVLQGNFDVPGVHFIEVD